MNVIIAANLDYADCRLIICGISIKYLSSAKLVATYFQNDCSFPTKILHPNH